MSPPIIPPILTLQTYEILCNDIIFFFQLHKFCAIIHYNSYVHILPTHHIRFQSFLRETVDQLKQCNHVTVTNNYNYYTRPFFSLFIDT